MILFLTILQVLISLKLANPDQDLWWLKSTWESRTLLPDRHLPTITGIVYIILMNTTMVIRARWEIKNQNYELHTWILIGNWILNLIYFLQFFDLSTPSAAKMQFYFLPFLQGKNTQNRPENQQDWNVAKIGLKSDIFMKLSFLSPILAKFQFCWFSGLFWAFFPCKKCKK